MHGMSLTQSLPHAEVALNMNEAKQPELCPRILLVEDDPDQRDLISEALRMYFDESPDRRIETADSVSKARTFDPCAFDIILLDYNLPDGTGLDVLAHFSERGDTPVIFVTGENVVETANTAIRNGAQDYVIKLGDYLFAIPIVVEKNLRQHRTRQENVRLQAQLEATLEEVRVKNIQLEESLAKLEHMASTDYLTGLTNRRHFAELLDRYYSEALRYEFDLTCVMIDLDHYKSLNDTLGHQMGDRILIAASEVIRENLRASDIAARYGGDEFVLLLPHTSMDLGLNVSERIRQGMAEASRQYLDIGRTLTMSMGMSNLLSDRPGSADELVAMADSALYAAKDAGKNRIITHLQMTRQAG